MMSTPPATTATVPTASAASWAAESMPRARPDTTTMPAKPKSRANMSANLRASALALRAPTMAIISFCKRCGWPSRLSTGGGASSAFNPARIVRLAGQEQAAAQRRQLFQFAFGIAFRRQHEILAATAPTSAAASQARQFLQRGGGRAKTRQKIVKGHRTDILGTRQPQPRAAFGICSQHYLAPMRG